MEQCTITVKDVAKYLGVHTDTIYDLVREGSFPHIRFGRKILFSKDAIDAWIRAQADASVTNNGE
ncbi:helix-turn-helix domain-containing protein [Aquibacillus koreensis]|uniref:Helix-turn-helix domain-containing protein n=1 Tax=Aquibacillus koreensis TaxID=279446 RepID=A0A9X3WJS2_9BACI|nr:helix-turn-helix domain-containing protein [Aquibacillus koreensis]MCT2534788.1 helix-turn-helix domain-containing protein [Aquibacillus koreensis]MDC3419601.1 helix-turn-helix domain-containing protein [Aquibacillus koreensis]